MLIQFPIEEEKGEPEQSMFHVAHETGGDKLEDKSKRTDNRVDSGLSKIESGDDDHEGVEGDYFTTLTQKT